MSLTLATATLLGAGIAGLASLANSSSQSSTNLRNIKAQKEMNAANIAAQKEMNAANIASQENINQSQLDYARAMTQAQWERDDNAHQREVADLQAAGLSPLANTAGSQVTSAMDWNPVAPRGESMPEQYAYMEQAPQFDVNTLVQSLLKGKELEEQSRQFDEKLIREDKSLELTAQNIALRTQELDIENSKVDAQLLQIANAYDLGVKQFSLSKAELEQRKKEFGLEQHKQYMENSKWIFKQYSDNNLRIADTVAKAQDKGYLFVHPYTDWNSYEEAFEAYGKKLETFLASKGISRIGEISVNFKAGEYEKSGGAGFGFGGTYKPNSFREELLYKQFQAENAYPVFVYGYVDWKDYDNLRVK